MKYIMEHFGSGFLSGIVAVPLLSFFIGMLRKGMIYTIIMTFLNQISG